MKPQARETLADLRRSLMQDPRKVGPRFQDRSDSCTKYPRSALALLQGEPVSVRERLDHVLGLPHQAKPRENEINRRLVMLSRAATHRIFSEHE
jgi:hypothetical protein